MMWFQSIFDVGFFLGRIRVDGVNLSSEIEVFGCLKFKINATACI